MTTSSSKFTRLRDYASLMRLDKPIGIFLLLWPTLWALLIASAGNPDPKVLLIFVAGVVLMCSAVNEIDLSALESLEAINHRLDDMGIVLNLSEVKGPVTDRLQRGNFLDHLTGKVFLSQFEAFQELRTNSGQAHQSDVE